MLRNKKCCEAPRNERREGGRRSAPGLQPGRAWKTSQRSKRFEGRASSFTAFWVSRVGACAESSSPFPRIFKKTRLQTPATHAMRLFSQNAAGCVLLPVFCARPLRGKPRRGAARVSPCCVLGRIDIQAPPPLPIAARQARRDEGAGRHQQPKSNDAWRAAMGNPSGQGPGQPPASLLAAGVSRYTARLAPSR